MGWRKTITQEFIPSTDPGDPFKIMMLGDSNMAGSGSDGGIAIGGRRIVLYQELREVRGDFKLIGSLISGRPGYGVLGDWRHDGHPGFKIEDLTAGYTSYVAEAGQPDIVISNCGTNNITNGDTAAQMMEKISAQDAEILRVSPYTRILRETIPPFGYQTVGYAAYNVVVAAFNALLLAEYPRPDSGAQVVAIDTCGTLTQGDLLTDGVHINQQGFSKIGELEALAIDDMQPIRTGPFFPRDFRLRTRQPSISVVADTDRLTIVDSKIEPPQAGNFAICLNLRPSSLPADTLRAIAGYGTSYPNGYLLGYDGSGVSPVLNFYLTSAGAVITSKTTLAASRWNRIVVTYDATAQIAAIWINGVLNAVGEGIAQPAPVVGAQTSLGRNINAYPAIPGLYDNFSMHKGVLVPAFDDLRPYIERDYIGGSYIPGLTGLLLMNEGVGVPADNMTTPAVNSVLTGAVWAAWAAGTAKPWDE